MNPFFETSIKPRFSETDMRGHINNTAVSYTHLTLPTNREV